MAFQLVAACFRHRQRLLAFHNIGDAENNGFRAAKRLVLFFKLHFSPAKSLSLERHSFDGSVEESDIFRFSVLMQDTDAFMSRAEIKRESESFSDASLLISSKTRRLSGAPEHALPLQPLPTVYVSTLFFIDTSGTEYRSYLMGYLCAYDYLHFIERANIITSGQLLLDHHFLLLRQC